MPKATTPAVETTPNPITAAVEANKGNGRRPIRNAALAAAAAAYGPFTIVERVQLDTEAPKFKAWITGARGRSGYIIAGSMGKAIVGRTTVLDFIDAEAVTNADDYKELKDVDAATMNGLIG